MRPTSSHCKVVRVGGREWSDMWEPGRRKIKDSKATWKATSWQTGRAADAPCPMDRQLSRQSGAWRRGNSWRDQCERGELVHGTEKHRHDPDHLGSECRRRQRKSEKRPG